MRHNFEHSDTAMLFEQFKMAEAACRYIDAGGSRWQRPLPPMALPAASASRQACSICSTHAG
jgi:glycyl-tRNA synthetase alpha chain